MSAGAKSHLVMDFGTKHKRKYCVYVSQYPAWRPLAVFLI